MAFLRKLVLAVLCFGAIPALAQISSNDSADSVLLNVFWKELSSTVDRANKDRMVTFFHFPFYCRPCVDDTSLDRTNNITVHVTKAMFRKSVAEFLIKGPFGEAILQNRVVAVKNRKTAQDDSQQPGDLIFTYRITAPHPPFEGKQGWLSVGKRKGKFQITGIHIIP